MTVRVSVYQKDGLCRGPPIYYSATFEAARSSGLLYLPEMPLNFTQPDPLSGTAPVYTVFPPVYQGILFTEWYLRVASPIHSPCDFFVRDGETHEVWLSRR
jgi:hypothetical protein